MFYVMGSGLVATEQDVEINPMSNAHRQPTQNTELIIAVYKKNSVNVRSVAEVKRLIAYFNAVRVPVRIFSYHQGCRKKLRTKIVKSITFYKYIGSRTMND